MSDQDFRISDAEREQAAAELGEHYAQGRLTMEEHADRLDQVWAARTRGELLPIFRDLPSRYTQPSPAYYPAGATRVSGPRPAGPPWRRGLPAPLMVVLAVLVFFTVVTHLPLILLGLVVWWFLAARHRRCTGPRRW
jgi:DUF1707 SHOCT-like domain